MNTIGLKIRAAVAAALVTGSAALAASSVSQTVTFAVTAINEVSVSGNPGTLTVSAATAGSAPNSVSDTSTTYAITTNENTRKITAEINSAMPDGVTLQVVLGAPTNATSAGTITLGTTAADAVTGITRLNESGKSIGYTLSATAAAGTVTSTTRTVTYTITAGS